MSGKKAKKATATPDPVSAKKPTRKKPIVKNGNAGIRQSDDQPLEKSSIFGDWTGKTPVSLLHEHCQKQGWEKPNFDMARNKHGFLSTVRLGKRNKKTAQIQTVILTPPSDNVSFSLPTAVEARHVAATMALHRVNSHMPLHRALPPQHRDFWHQFEQLKTPANAWQYVPDPFTAVPPASAALRAARSASAADKRPSKEHATAAVPLPPSDHAHPPQRREQLQKEWEHLPAVHMSAELRAYVEDVIKKESLVYQPIQKGLSPKAKEEIERHLLSMGFRSAHIEEALEYCSDTAEALDWLCLHVPEDDLPSQFILANYDPKMTTISHTTQSLGRDWLLKRMSTIGYPVSICKEAMEKTSDNELDALALLQWRLVHGETPMSALDDATLDTDELVTTREEEAMALESIYGTRFEQDQSEKDRVHFRIRLTACLSPTSRARVPLVLDTIIPQHSNYPHTPPVFAIICEHLPLYLKLSMIKGVVEEAEKNLGAPLVYMCAEWLQDHVDELIEKPPKLREVTEKMLTFAHPPPAHKASRKPPSSRRRSGWPEGTHEQLKADLIAMRASEQYTPLGRVRSRLPADGFQSKVIETVLANQVTIVSGETGCGKTTQVPQFILDEEIMQDRGAQCSILCTQPRKISALGVAERVAAERCEKVGKTVGYAIRGETKTCAQTRLQFCTTGVLLRRLHSDPLLHGVSHVMIDEVHERSVDSDFLLIILKDVIKRRKDLKIVLMSATLNQELFSSYFGGAPSIEIPGFTHPVEDFYLEDVLKMTSFVSKMPLPKEDKDSKGEWATVEQEYLDQGYDEQVVKTLARYRKHEKIDYDLVAQTVHYIVENDTVEIEGGTLPAVLIFMPGAMEIRRCVDSLQQALGSSSAGSLEILPLHANLSPQEQARVFRPVRQGARKVVVATNVAETSITIEGVVYVIDAGRVKETQYEAANNMVHLVETWASRASCKQRRGRAGRTRPGQCFKLFTRKTEANKMRAQQVPELLRTPLEQLCLQVKAMGEDNVKTFLRRAIDPPSVDALDRAIHTLRAVDAIDSTELGALTPLGKHMASIPADLRISKMLLLGAVFRCLDPVLTVAATMSLKSPFTSPMDKRDEARREREGFLHGKSDWLTDMNAFEKWQKILQDRGMREARKFCEAHFLSFNTLSEIQSLKRQYKDALEETGFVIRSRMDDYDTNATNTNLVKAVVFGGLNPNLARIRLPDSKYDKVLSGTVEREKEARDIKFYTQHDGRVFLHPASILFGNNQYGTSSFLTYFSRMTTTKTFLRDATELSAYAVLFFGGQVNVDHLRRGLQVGPEGWVKLRAWARIGVLVNQLKRLLQAALHEKIENPNLDVSASPVVQAMMALIATDGI